MADDGAEKPTVETSTPEAAFGLLSHEIRFGILRALHDADGVQSFSALRDAVGVDDPGQFNYHLGELVGRFVRSTESGYRLAAAGQRVVGAVLSGGVTMELDAEPVATDAPCPACGAAMTARFRSEGIAIECPACELQYTDPDVPPGLVDAVATDEVADVVERWGQRNRASAGYGLCHNCDGPITTEVVLPGDARAPDWLDGDDLETTVVYECDRCGESWHAIVPLAALSHPAVMGFHHDHDIDLRTTPTWNLPWLAVDGGTVTDRDPLRVTVTMTLDDETATFTFDRDLSVVSEQRDPSET